MKVIIAALLIWIVTLLEIFVLLISCEKPVDSRCCIHCTVKTVYYEERGEGQPDSIAVYGFWTFCDSCEKAGLPEWIKVNTWEDTVNKIRQKVTCRQPE